jgi:K+-transporting ATPase ATPase A chain
MGPVASQEAIKMLGTNGGGFFNANSSHPFENPTALTNCADAGDLPDPGGAVLRLWRCGQRSPPGRAILWAMSLIFVVCVAVVMWAEWQGNPH